MKKINLILLIFLITLSACSTSKPKPKLCTVTIADPAKKTNQNSKCVKRKTLWSQLGIEK